MRYVIATATGPQAGRATLRLQPPLLAAEPGAGRAKPFAAARDGSSLNWALACEAQERAKLERVCRYMARGPIAEQRLSVDGDALVVLELKRAFTEGTTHVLFEPEDFIARLAALVARPRAHLFRYHGPFAPNPPERAHIVARPRAQSQPPSDEPPPSARTTPMSSMARLSRVFAIDRATCPKGGGELRVIAESTDPGVIARILEHLRQRLGGPAQPRAPPRAVAS